MLRAIACILAVSTLPFAANAQELNFNIIQESFSLTKADILEAKQDFQDSRPIVRVKLGPTAAARFGEVTSRNVSKLMQVAIGDRILTAPVIMSAITGGEVVIRGNFTIQEADDLAKQIK